MTEQTVASGALCLIRLLPLLKVLESSVRQPVDEVIRGCLGSGEIADGVLIGLDEFCEAVGPLQDFDHPAFFEQSVAGMALIAAGAGEVEWSSADARVSEQAAGVWSTLTRLVNEQQTRGPASPTVADFAELERTAQREDERALVSRERDPMAVIRRADQLASAGPAMTAELSKVSALLGWRPSGPCGPQCTWPACESSASNCVRRRAFRPQQRLAARLRRKQGAEPRPWYLISINLLAADDKPFEFLTEIGTDGYELRKVAQYMDGRLVCVDRDHQRRGEVELGSERVPSWTELEADEDLHVEETSAEFFERRWKEGHTGFIGHRSRRSRPIRVRPHGAARNEKDVQDMSEAQDQVARLAWLDEEKNTTVALLLVRYCSWHMDPKFGQWFGQARDALAQTTSAAHSVLRGETPDLASLRAELDEALEASDPDGPPFEAEITDHLVFATEVLDCLLAPDETDALVQVLEHADELAEAHDEMAREELPAGHELATVNFQGLESDAREADSGTPVDKRAAVQRSEKFADLYARVIGLSYSDEDAGVGG
ncbi:DUF6881 domain-containing protein [Streptomyces sp. NPDC086766]|uniref:DUF6881 domain-containing protein n=1 Tax=Streptomyces sp. NPDC086766 TaxID=3365754 RepID=UPI00382AB8DE